MRRVPEPARPRSRRAPTSLGSRSPDSSEVGIGIPSSGPDPAEGGSGSRLRPGAGGRDGRSGLILASGSPRRAELLRQVGIPFEVVVSQISEGRWRGGDDFASLTGKVALEKASSVSRTRPGRLVVGADTVVVCDNELLGKPSSKAQATKMLEKLSGREHYVVTGVALCRSDDSKVESLVGWERTTVKFRPLEKEEICAYVETGEPLDKAGGYGIQGRGALLIEGIEGCYSNVVGLPLARLYEMLKRWGCELLG